MGAHTTSEAQHAARSRVPLCSCSRCTILSRPLSLSRPVALSPVLSLFAIHTSRPERSDRARSSNRPRPRHAPRSFLRPPPSYVLVRPERGPPPPRAAPPAPHQPPSPALSVLGVSRLGMPAKPPYEPVSVQAGVRHRAAFAASGGSNGGGGCSRGGGAAQAPSAYWISPCMIRDDSTLKPSIDGSAFLLPFFLRPPAAWKPLSSAASPVPGLPLRRPALRTQREEGKGGWCRAWTRHER